MSDAKESLNLAATIGFAGKVPGGLLVHPDRQHLIYPLGSMVVIEDLATNKQDLLSDYKNVSCVAVSKSGKYLASGEETHMGFDADVILWDYAKRELIKRFKLHKVKVEALAFSANDLYLISLGGQDDRSVVVWNLATLEPICGSPAAPDSAGTTFAVTCANHNDDVFVTGGNKTLRVWQLDLHNRKIRPTDVNMGQLKRIVKCIQMDHNDTFFYCGTTTGDILQINAKTKLLKEYGPHKEKLGQGVLSLQFVKTGEIIAGAGDGSVAIISHTKFTKTRVCKIGSGISSIALRGQGHQFYVGTVSSEMFRFDYAEFSHERIKTCHDSMVNDIVFPFAYSEVFATCSKSEIRIWNTQTNQELLRIEVPNMTCNALDFMRDGQSIVSGWNDGRIRAFTPETGSLMYEIHNAHTMGVTALATTSDCQRIISGGGEGQVRVWKITSRTQNLKETMKEQHKGAVTCIKIRNDDSACVSASTDGTCIIWDLTQFVRNQIVFAATMFKAVCYYQPDECQIITTGEDRKVAYWDLQDGSQIRELDGSSSGSIEGMDISSDEQDHTSFVTGGQDKLIKVWDYHRGVVTHIGKGHGGDVTKVKICPNRFWIVSVGVDGGILKWSFPRN